MADVAIEPGELRRRAAERLRAVGQSHLLAFVDDLDDASRGELLRQIDGLDLEGMPALIERYARDEAPFALPPGVGPASYYPRDPGSPGGGWDRDRFRAAGEALLRGGRIGCFTVAGGQGSRLGFEGPKGCYPTGCVTGKPLFRIFAEKILATRRRYGAPIPWYIMTSPLNHAATVAFFRDNNFFGLAERDVMFFPQGVMPSIELATGRLMLAERHEVATNPDGHGGAYAALVRSGAVDDMRRRGVEHVSYFQVDNPNVTVADPVFLGLHAHADGGSGCDGGRASSAEMSSKMLPKADPLEKVGVFCEAGGRTMIIEYSDLPEDLAREADPSTGRLRYLAGSIAIHAIGVGFIEKVVSDPDYELPFHRAVKAVPHVDLATGERVEPAEKNAVKLERFVFDAIAFARSSIVLETDRVEEFAPVKNREGVDSIVTSRRLQTEKAARWLEAAGTVIPRDADGAADCTIEISPLSALFPEDVASMPNRPAAIERGQVIAL